MLMPANTGLFGMDSELVAVGAPNSSAIADVLRSTYWKQPGAPIPVRSVPGLIWPKLAMCRLIAAVNGMFRVVQTSVEPSTGAGDPLRARSRLSAGALKGT